MSKEDKTMKPLLIVFTLLVMTLFQTVQSFEGFNQGVSLKLFNRINCGSNVTCTRAANGVFSIDAPAINGTFVGNLSAVDATLSGNLVAVEGTFSDDVNAVKGVFSGEVSGTTGTFSGAVAGTTGTFTGAVSGTSGTFTGDVTGDGADQMYGFLQNQVEATAVTITASQCGSTFINSGAVLMALPEASTVLGCRLTFVTGNASNFDVNPDDADIILTQTNAAGDAMRNATLGNSITIQAISASQWVTISVNGTYSDID